MEAVSNEFVQKLVSRLEKGFDVASTHALPEISEVSFGGMLSEMLPALGKGQLGPLAIPDPAEGHATGSETIAALPGALQPSLRETMITEQRLREAGVGRAPLNLQALKGRSDDEAIEEVARQFESQFLYGMLKQIWESLPQGSLFGGDSAGQYYREMWLEQLASSISSGPNGIGLAEVVKRDLQQRAAESEPSQTAALPAASDPDSVLQS